MNPSGVKMKPDPEPLASAALAHLNMHHRGADALYGADHSARVSVEQTRVRILRKIALRI